MAEFYFPSHHDILEETVEESPILAQLMFRKQRSKSIENLNKSSDVQDIHKNSKRKKSKIKKVKTTSRRLVGEISQM